ncbi:MAG: PH domain-containing protein [Micromonosporaceae bacterium]
MSQPQPEPTGPDTAGPHTPGAGTAATGTVEPRRRLHPLTPLLRGARSFAVVVAAISLQGFAQLGLQRGAIAVLIAVLGALVISWFSWLFTGYHIVNRELRVHEGLLWRRSRAIALERLQTVEVVRPLLARLTGLAELRLEVVGAAKTEAPLAFLTVAQAKALQDRLLSLSGRHQTAAETAGPLPGAAAATDTLSGATLHRVRPRDLLLAQLLTPQALFVPVALIGPLAAFLLSPDFTLVGIAGAAFAAIGVALQPVRRVIADYGFAISTANGGLRLRHGLLETRSRTVPVGRVQALAVTWPLLWRPMGWLQCQIDVAGQTGAGDETAAGGTLLPVAEPTVARTVIAQVLPQVDVAELPLRPVARQARLRAPLSYRVLAAGLSERVFAVRYGLLTRRLALAPYERIQSVRLTQGPWQRALGLASVHADTAGGGILATADHRDLNEAHWLAAELTERARRARAADQRDRDGQPDVPDQTHGPGRSQPAASSADVDQAL